MKIKFKDAGHKEFFLSVQESCREWDTYHKALFYCLGISPDCRKHVHDIFNFSRSDYGIKPDTVFDNAWLTSSSRRCIQLGYNLFNGFCDDETSPYSLFADSDAVFYQEAVKVRYPEYLEEKEHYCITDEKGHILAENVFPKMIAESYVRIYEREYGGTYEIKPQEPLFLDL